MPTGFPDYYGGLTLPVTVPEGGTGYTNVDAHALLVGNASGKLNLIEPSTTGQVLTAQGSTLDPVWAAISVAAGNISGILPVVNGGTGTATPALVAGTGISIAGTWPAQTIANSSAYAALADPLPVAHGGTGTATPALVAGTNIAITGAWPGQTVTFADPLGPSLTMAGTANVVLTLTSTTSGAVVVEYDSADHKWQVGNTAGGLTGFNILDVTNNVQAARIDDSDVFHLANPLPIASGGTGKTDFYDAGLPYTVSSVALSAQTASIGSTALAAATGNQTFRVSVECFANSPTGTSSLTVTFSWVEQGATITTNVIVTGSLTGTGKQANAMFYLQLDSSNALHYATTWSSGGGSDAYSLNIRQERI